MKPKSRSRQFVIGAPDNEMLWPTRDYSSLAKLVNRVVKRNRYCIDCVIEKEDSGYRVDFALAGLLNVRHVNFLLTDLLLSQPDKWLEEYCEATIKWQTNGL